MSDIDSNLDINFSKTKTKNKLKYIYYNIIETIKNQYIIMITYIVLF